MLTQQRIDDILAITPDVFDPEQAGLALLASVRRHLVPRFVDSVTDRAVHPKYVPATFGIQGISDGILRFQVRVAFRKMPPIGLAATPRQLGLAPAQSFEAVQILRLIATHGDVPANDNLVGARIRTATGGTGNDLLVARLLDVALFQFRRAGALFVYVRAIEGLKRHYTEMGFQGGSTLVLTNEEHLDKAFSYIEATYDDYGVTGEFARPPL